MAEFRADSAALVAILAAIIRQAHVSVIGTATYVNGELWKVCGRLRTLTPLCKYSASLRRRTTRKWYLRQYNEPLSYRLRRPEGGPNAV
jgi:hypothetical protein